MQSRLKKIFFVLLLAIMSVPLFQRVTRLFKETELRGAFFKPVQPKFSVDSLSTSAFQKQTEAYENFNFGFRGFMIKLKNSVDFLLYKDISVTDQLEGKNGYIFSWGSIDRNITGDIYNGKVKNDATVSAITFLRNEIEKKGARFLVAFAPSKDIIYPELLPEKYDGAVRLHSDRQDLADGFKKNNIPFIDFTPYFQSIHKKTSEPLFTKTGFHWSVYGASIAQDSLLSFMQQMYNEPMIACERKGVEQSDTARWPDADFEVPMNLLFSLQDNLYLYPKVEIIQSTLTRHRPKVIVIGDSFFATIKDQLVLRSIFSTDSKYWYYFNRSIPFTGVDDSEMKDIDIITELESADFIILFGSLCTLGDFPYGFYDYYYKNVKLFGMVGRIEEYLKKDSLQINKIRKEAALKNESLESVITSEARSIFKKRTQFHLQSPDHKYICADANKNNCLFANRDVAWAWETFSLLPLGNDKFVMYSFESKFLTTEMQSQKEITASRQAIGEWEIFSMTRLDSSHVAFKGFNGKYLSVNKSIPGGQIFSSADTIGYYEKFIMTEVQ